MNIKIRKTDKLFREYLLKLRNYKSDYDGAYYPEGKGLQVSHFKGRRRENTRFDPENCDLFPFNIHQHFEENPDEYVAFKKKQLGEKRYKALLIRAETYCKKDDKLQTIILKKLLEE